VKQDGHLDARKNLRLTTLTPEEFERFFLHFLNSRIALTIARDGQAITKRIISAETYCAGSGRKQKGIDLKAEIEGREVWVFQCKQHKSWNVDQTRKAIEAAKEFPAQHYFLLVACDPGEGVQDYIENFPNWTFWNLDKICSEFRLRVPTSEHPRVLFFLTPEELKFFVPFATQALISPQQFFEPFLGPGKTFRHDWKLAGRQREIRSLTDFIAGRHKVMILTARGGVGKTRLLREMSSRLQQEFLDTEILFLNPHRQQDEIAFVFSGHPYKRVIVVDDAHRIEQIPGSLLTCVRQNDKTKLLLATRPQAVEALKRKLSDAGLAGKTAIEQSLGNLGKSELEDLAREALGAALAGNAGAVAQRVGDSPFLVVVAAELLRSGRLTWTEWLDSEDLRGEVFRRFEERSLELLPQPDKNLARGLLRMIALLAPVVLDVSFSEKAARILGPSRFCIESLLPFVRTEFLGGQDTVRVVPDLFADSLIYESCYGRAKRPGLIQDLLQEFPERTAALLRNLSEAIWLARANQHPDEPLVRAIIESESKRFENVSFRERAEILQVWSAFAVFLPRETLELAELAMEMKEAPVDGTPFLSRLYAGKFDTHQYVKQQISSMIMPIANHYTDHVEHALEIFWRLAREEGGQVHRDHPMGTLASVFKFHAYKEIGVLLRALGWLKSKLDQPETLKMIETSKVLLRTLLSHCFERSIEFSKGDENSVTIWREGLPIDITQPIRDAALDIIEDVIRKNSTIAVLDALSALEPALERAEPNLSAELEDNFLAQWRTERLKALPIFEETLRRHSVVAVRFQIRQFLRRTLFFEKDRVMAERIRAVLGLVIQDLPLRAAVVLLSQGYYESEARNEDWRQLEAVWNERTARVADELASTYPGADSLAAFLNSLAEQLTVTGDQHLSFTPLFAKLAQGAPELAFKLAQHLMKSAATSILVQSWPALMEANPLCSENDQIELFRKGVETGNANSTISFISKLARRAQLNESLPNSVTALLIELAEKASQEETLFLLQLVSWSSDENVDVCFRILEKLPIRKFASDLMGHVLEALVPHQRPRAAHPTTLIKHILKQLIEVPQIDLREHSQQWDHLIQRYPREIYNFVHSRVLLHAKQRRKGFSPVPRRYKSGFKLPALRSEPDYSEICSEIWKHALVLDDDVHYWWAELFKAVVLEVPEMWVPRLLREIESSGSEKGLLNLIELLRFDGSLIIFCVPEVTKAFLKRSAPLGAMENIKWALIRTAGPQVRAYTNDALDPDDDYVEAAAIKAAEENVDDPDLGQFYRWVVKIEQQSRKEPSRVEKHLEGCVR
jgi:hypothetical protein